MQYIGELYSIDSEYGQKKLKEYSNKACTYLMSISNKNEVIDPTYKGNLARFINHSCEPNCETQKWHVLSEVCVGIFTLRDIEEGEELTFNYGFDKFKTTFQKCLCGTPSCKSYLGLVNGNEIPKDPSSIACEICKFPPRASENIIACEKCKRIYHRVCLKKSREIIKEKYFICNICLKREKPSEKKSSQQLIKEMRIKKKIEQKSEQPDMIESDFNYVNEIINNISLNKAEEKTHYKEDEEEEEEEEQEIEENIEVDNSQLSRIRKNLKKILSDVGARMFWEARQTDSQSTYELKITGTLTQIEKVKQIIKEILDEKDTRYYFYLLSDGLYTISLNVPKIFVRRIIGHQSRNL
jgi:hypothetical protein